MPLPSPRTKTLLFGTLVFVLLLEIAVFNIPHWNSLTKPEPEQSSTLLGPGLERRADGTLRITDSSRAYIDTIVNDKQVEYVHLTPSSTVRYQYTVSSDTATRIDVLPSSTTDDWQTGHVDSFCYRTPYSAYLKNRTGYSGTVARVRVWFQEARGSRIPVSNIVVNARVPFRFDILRVILLWLICGIIIAIRPRSRLHRIAIDTQSVKQRLLFAGAIGVPCTVAFLWALIGNGLTQAPTVYHNYNSYVYDFNQFQETADAIFHGRAWLDLYIAPDLANSSNPYDAGVREQLLARGTYPIYWDHVYYNGHYYSYFGVIPVILLFLPYQAITSLWVDGGLPLSTTTAGAFMLCLAVVFGSLCIVRFLQRHFPGASIGMALILFFLLFSGSTIISPICRIDFYTIPFCAALCTSSIGLYLWQCALRVADPALGKTKRGRERTRVWTIDDKECDPSTIRIARGRLFWGTFFLVCTLGCRPPMAALCVLAIPMVIIICKQLSRKAAAEHASVARPIVLNALICAIPAAMILFGLGLWNYVRFGSFLDFGNNYQLTVVDLNEYHEPLNVFAEIVFYYLFLPLQYTTEFPFLTSPQTALSSWQCYEPIVGGMFFITPLLLVGLAFPFFKRQLSRRDGWLPCCLSAVFAMLMLAFISYKGGLLWRYKIDFAIFMSVVAMYMVALLMHWCASRSFKGTAYAVTFVVVLATVFSGILCLQCIFLRNVSYPVVNDQPAIFHYVRSWFQLLI